MGRDVPADIAAGRGILDLDDLRAEVGKLEAAERACPVLLDRDDAHIGKRFHWNTPLRDATSADTLAISLPTTIIPSSTPMPGFAST